MKIYEMFQALEMANQLNNAIGQNEEALKIYVGKKLPGYDDFETCVVAMSLKQFYDRMKQLGFTEREIKAVGTANYESELTTLQIKTMIDDCKYIVVADYTIEVYKAYDWEIDY